jgi:hypothetical protein
MTWSREPRIDPVAIMDLRPTQITVGMREVEAKRARWRSHPDNKKAQYLGSHLIPVVLGPKAQRYVIDHHHLVLALHREGVKQIATTIVADLCAQPRQIFWTYLEHHCWVHPYDEDGRRCGYNEIPKRITQMVDDPYRSLAGELRLCGGFSKDTTPFSEFLWADFLRRRVKRRQVERDFAAVMQTALRLARTDDASYLPGWCGPVHGYRARRSR